MAMDLQLWAELNLIGKVSYQEYLDMTREEAVACYQALRQSIERASASKTAMDDWNSHLQRYGG